MHSNYNPETINLSDVGSDVGCTNYTTFENHFNVSSESDIDSVDALGLLKCLQIRNIAYALRSWVSQFHSHRIALNAQ